jgi:anthranilate synthase component 1
MFVDTMLVFDHLKHTIKVVSHARLDGDIDAAYRQAVWRIDELVERLARPLPSVAYPVETSLGPGDQAVRSNVELEEYLLKVERCR